MAIIAKIESLKDTDFLGFKISDLIGYLDYEHAKPYLKPEVTADQWIANPSGSGCLVMKKFSAISKTMSTTGRQISLSCASTTDGMRNNGMMACA